MTDFEIYSLILCIIVFVMLTIVFSYIIALLTKQNIKHIKAGLDDQEILKEFDPKNKKIETKGKRAFRLALNVLLYGVLIFVFASSIYVSCTQDVYFENAPTYRVVLTSSMEEKNKNNQYLFDNNLDNQISAFDLILTYKIPKEEDLKLYDIVVYEVDDMLVVHRIVGIEEPNQYHPNERYFQLQGDAVGSPDRFPVKYEQMKAIYKNEKIPFVGSFIMFMQSPAGWICLILVVLGIFGTPILDKKLLQIRKDRYLLIAPINETIEEEVKKDVSRKIIVVRKRKK